MLTDAIKNEIYFFLNYKFLEISTRLFSVQNLITWNCTSKIILKEIINNYNSETKALLWGLICE